MTKRFDEYGPYGENNPPVGVRPLDAEERQRAKEREGENKAQYKAFTDAIRRGEK